jgi:hypothetical protein
MAQQATGRAYVMPPTATEDAPTLLLAAQSAMGLRYDRGFDFDGCQWWAAFAQRLASEMLDGEV